MSKFYRILSTILALICSINIAGFQTYAADFESEYTLANTSETVEIDGITYRYDFYADRGMRVVTITNLCDSTSDTVAYDPTTSVIYLNNSVYAEKLEDSIATNSVGTTADGWEILSKETYRITWAQGTTVAVVAGAISVYLSSLGPAGVIAAMGTGALGVLAGSASGGTLYLELHMYSAPFVTPQYRYQWSFTASTGDKYGPYYYLVTM